jgi:hypothetical protein
VLPKIRTLLCHAFARLRSHSAALIHAGNASCWSENSYDPAPICPLVGPCCWRSVNFIMCDVTLLSNGNYHVVAAAGGSGRSQWNHLGVTRWREDAALDDCGTFVRDAADPAAASVHAPTGWAAIDLPIATLSSIAVGPIATSSCAHCSS